MSTNLGAYRKLAKSIVKNFKSVEKLPYTQNVDRKIINTSVSKYVLFFTVGFLFFWYYFFTVSILFFSF